MTTPQQISLKQHPLSAAFPSMPLEELEALSSDIKKNGQREPGILYEGMVLDGWHRYQACDMAGVQFVAVPIDGEADPIDVALSRNLHRRHLSATQRAQAIVACTNWRPAGDRTGAELTAAQMANIADVSPRTIEQAKAAHSAGLGDAMRSGQVSAKRAAQIAKLPKAKREKALTAPAPKPKPEANAKASAELIDVQGKYADLLEQHSDLAATARELEDKLTAFEKTEPDEQQKEIQRLQKKVVKLEGEIEHQKRRANDFQAKNNELIREVKRLQKRG